MSHSTVYIDTEACRLIAHSLLSCQNLLDDLVLDLGVAEARAGFATAVIQVLFEVKADIAAAGAGLRRAASTIESFHLVLRDSTGLDAVAPKSRYPQTTSRSLADLCPVVAKAKAFGDLGGTGECETRRYLEHGTASLWADSSAQVPLSLASSDLSAQVSPTGNTTIANLLTLMGDRRYISPDEFAAILHTNGNLTIVLGGVTDLSKAPRLGYDPRNKTVRDLDKSALRSLWTTDLSSNRYAQMVADWVRHAIDQGLVKKGAQVLIVGHSYGADTAFDLAGDADFNGSLVNVTHLVAAGYHNEHQMSSLADQTKAMVLQNVHDAVHVAEGVAVDSYLLATRVHSASERKSQELLCDDLGLHPLLERTRVCLPIDAEPNHDKDDGFGKGMQALGRLAVEGAETTLEAVTTGYNAVLRASRRVEWPQMVPALVPAAVAIAPTAPERFEFAETEVIEAAPNVLLAEFEGGFDLKSFGHDLETYVNYISSPRDASLIDFGSEVEEAGFVSPGVLLAIDVSVAD